MSRVRYLGLVPARGGSKGIPRKNLVDLGGKPLVQYSIEAGLASSSVDVLLLSSEDEEILEVGRRLGCEVVHRPSELAGDEIPMIDVALHALDHAGDMLGLEVACLVLLQPTSPFRDAGDVDAAVATFEGSGADTLVSVVPVSQHPCDCVRLVGGRLERAVPVPHPNARRQEMPDYYFVDGAICIARAAFLREQRFFIDDRTALHVHAHGLGLDIDDSFDLDVARGLVAHDTLA